MDSAEKEFQKRIRIVEHFWGSKEVEILQKVAFLYENLSLYLPEFTTYPEYKIKVIARMLLEFWVKRNELSENAPINEMFKAASSVAFSIDEKIFIDKSLIRKVEKVLKNPKENPFQPQEETYARVKTFLMIFPNLWPEREFRRDLLVSGIMDLLISSEGFKIEGERLRVALEKGRDTQLEELVDKGTDLKELLEINQTFSIIKAAYTENETNLRRKLEAIESRLKISKNRPKIGKTKSVERKIKDIREKIFNDRKEIEESELKKDELERKISSLEEEIRELKIEASAQNEKRIKELDNEISKKKSELDELKSEIERLGNRIKRLEGAIERLKSFQTQLDINRFYLFFLELGKFNLEDLEKELKGNWNISSEELVKKLFKYLFSPQK